MKLGKLRHRITIGQVSETQDVDGHVLESWSAYAMVQASIEPVSGREYFETQYSFLARRFPIWLI